MRQPTRRDVRIWSEVETLFWQAMYRPRMARGCRRVGRCRTLEEIDREGADRVALDSSTGLLTIEWRHGTSQVPARHM
jgi:hypothetical protein